MKNLQNKYGLEDAQAEPIVYLIANDNWVKFTLRYVVSYKKRRATKTILFSKILKEIDTTNREIKFASTTFQLVQTPDLNINIKK